MAARKTAGRAVRTAVERSGRGKNPVVRRKPATRKRPATKRNGQAPPLTVRGIGLLAGGLLLGVGAGVTLERTLVGRDRRRDDPEATEPFGRIRGTPAKGEPGVAEWAAALGTIDYEITCGLSPRLPRVHHHAGHPAGRPSTVEEAVG